MQECYGIKDMLYDTLRESRKSLTKYKACTMCINSEWKQGAKKDDYRHSCYCNITGDDVEQRFAKNCKNWKAKYPEFEKV